MKIKKKMELPFGHVIYGTSDYKDLIIGKNGRFFTAADTPLPDTLEEVLNLGLKPSELAKEAIKKREIELQTAKYEVEKFLPSMNLFDELTNSNLNSIDFSAVIKPVEKKRGVVFRR